MPRNVKSTSSALPSSASRTLKSYTSTAAANERSSRTTSVRHGLACTCSLFEVCICFNLNQVFADEHFSRLVKASLLACAPSSSAPLTSTPTYTEMELKGRNVQHARNLFDRAVTLLSRFDQLCYKYVYLEELLQNVSGARQVFKLWIQWEPDDKAWQAYIKLEQRYQELDRARAISERWVAVRPEPRVWVKWGKFQEERGRLDKAREVFQTALEFFGDDREQIEKGQAVFNVFAKMETHLSEYERARVIYKVRSYCCCCYVVEK